MAYNKQVWQSGQLITATKMNNIENGIDELNSTVTNMSTRLTNLAKQVGKSRVIEGGYSDSTLRMVEDVWPSEVLNNLIAYNIIPMLSISGIFQNQTIFFHFRGMSTNNIYFYYISEAGRYLLIIGNINNNTWTLEDSTL